MSESSFSPPPTPDGTPKPLWRSVLPPAAVVLAGVSGGADSLCLAMLLQDLEVTGEIGVLHLAYVHHGTSHADEAERWVRAFAEERDLPLTVLRITAMPANGSLEAQWREERLRLLREEALRLGADALALGHHADDAAETFLLMALRGSGPTGLGSLRPARRLAPDSLWLLRPLLSMTRAEVEKELTRRGQRWIDDPSNADPDLAQRNRLRHDVLPLLRKLEPQATLNLAQSEAFCGEEADMLEELVRGSTHAWPRAGGEGWSLLDRRAVARAPEPLRRAALRAWWRGLSGQSPSRATLDAVVARTASPSGEPARFGPNGGARVVILFHDVLLMRAELDETTTWAEAIQATGRAVLAPPDFSPTPVPEEGTLLARLAFSRAMVRRDAIDVMDPALQSHCKALLSTDQLLGTLVLRTLEPEDRLLLAGGGSRAAFDALAEAGVPSFLRPRVLALCDREGPLWIPCIRRAARAWVRGQEEVLVCEVLDRDGMPASGPALA